MELQRFILQVESPGDKPTLAAIEERLRGTGIKLDAGYGPIAVNPRLGRYVVRGSGTPRAKARARRIPGITLFADSKVQST